MAKRIKNEEGFTLLEAILSIALLAFVSSFVLKMFLVSNSVNAKAHNTDIALNTATSVIELLKNSQNPNRYIEHPFFQHCSITSDDKQTIIYKAYNTNWEQISFLNENTSREALFPDLRYLLTITLDREKVTDMEMNKQTGQLTTIHVQIDDYYQGSENQLVYLEGKKYFSLP